jgi:hypothetical protein
MNKPWQVKFADTNGFGLVLEGEDLTQPVGSKWREFKCETEVLNPKFDLSKAKITKDARKYLGM